MKKYILIAGVNGAGKSTLYQTLDSLKDMPRVNTDEIVKDFGDWKNPADIMKAGKIAVKNIYKYFEEGITFNQETTLCGNSIIRNIEKAKTLGYKIEIHYVGVDSVQIAKERIAYRVAHGGHGIPDEDVERRYEESLKRLSQIIGLCDLIVMYDNTDSFRRFAVYENGELHKLMDELPEWYKRIV
ncbi:MAG: zeta toxin family protein [Lachnospiraceae bacterium]|nr:zeta toxin family protein [Lachnospiraceae bacterium]